MRRRDFITAAAGGAAGLGAGRLIWGRGGSSWPAEARMTFSQQGEDIVLYHVVRDLLRVEKATYMDVGAAEPVLSNNTYLLWGVGHRGVLVEPNPALAKKLRDYRSGDKVVEAGVGVTDQTEADYYEIKGNPMLNTFSPDQVKSLEAGGEAVERVRKMPLININRIIEEQLGKAPDVLSTDIEGMDYSIIKTLDLARFRPGAICAETVAMSPGGDNSEITTYLVSQGYCVRGGSTINTIYVDSKRL
ncbi:MAG TPA: FkbM family methyltransferase [Vicinamibacterales bacterium]|nr:FkbM family methyltransferase [Vicinamibacterales bacterium]